MHPPVDPLRRLVELRAEQKEIEERIEAIKPLAMLFYKAEIGDKPFIRIGDSAIGLQSRRTWRYSEGLEEARKALKMREKEEQDNGEAVAVATEYLAVIPVDKLSTVD